ncbi:MFS transporter [Brevibacterium litoralis]|uniref:MFS transporter n=1 Tax=Brevibacterium litoralis TaxID=3138935 RepID=UPI0032EB6EC3
MVTILWPVLVPSILFASGAGAVVPVIVLAALEVGASPAFAAAIVAIRGAVSLCFTVPAGALIDRVGDTRAMYGATAASIGAFGIVVLGLAWDSPASLVLYVVGLVLFAPIADVWNLARQAVVADSLPTAQVGRAMTALGGTMRAGTLVGPIIGAGLMLVLPIWSVFVFACLAGFAAVGVLTLPAARTLDTRREESRSATGRAGSRSATAGAGGKRRARLDVRWNAVALAGVSIATLAVARAIQPVAVQLWGVEVDLHESTISLLIALGAALELCLMAPGARVKDQLGRVPSLFTCLAVFALGFGLMVAWPGVLGLVVAVGVMAVGNGMGAGINMTIGADLSPAVGRARFLGIWALYSTGGRLGGPAVFSLVLGIVSLSGSVLVTGALAGFGAVWILLWSRRIGLPGRMILREQEP